MVRNAVTTTQSPILSLFLAVSKGDFPTCQSFIQQGAYVDSRDENGNSPLMMAVASPKQLKLVRMLVKTGAAVNGTNVLGETALLTASYSGNASTVKLLLKFGADPNVASRSGYTPLMAATDSGHSEIVQKLLKEGADPNARKRHGVTALMRAAEWGDHVIVQALVQAGADVNLSDDNGETALMTAAAMGYKEVVSALICAGAEPSVSRPDGWTAAMFAEAWGQSEVAEILKKTCTSDEEAAARLAATSLDETALVAQKRTAHVNALIGDWRGHLL